jgi:hypothetical protein
VVKRKKQPAAAKTLLPNIPSDCIATDKEFTVEVSLIGRTKPGVRRLMDHLCRDFSEVAQIASRLAEHMIFKILTSGDCEIVEFN